MSSGFKKKVDFRFYAELNDFLSIAKRKKAFQYHFWGKPSIKNAIQALGIPHTEVDLVLVNSEPVDFFYQLKPDDQISVYPVFESLDISAINPLRKKPLRNLRFVVDANLGKVAKYLRMLGFDTLYDNNFEDSEIVCISKEENRIILTRDLEILKQNAVERGYYLRSNQPKKQLVELIQRFDFMAISKPLSRCMKCNGKMSRVEKDAVNQLVDRETLETFNEFYQCTKCKKIYWKGSHYDRMIEMIAGIKDLIHEY